MKARQIVGIVLVILTVAYTVYLVAVMIRRINAVVLKDNYIKVFRYELVACGILVLFALDVRFGLFTRLNPGVLKAAGWVLRVLVALAAGVLLFLAAKVTAGSLVRTGTTAKQAIVLGLALENGQPTADLQLRMDTAERYLRENPDGTLILTGGNPDGSGRTEAAVMRELLAARGVPEVRMVLEDRAETTKENFRNAAKIADPAEPVVLISSDYHMDRAAQTARSAGFTKVLRMPAPSSPLYFGANVLWEVILELNELTLRQ